MAARTFDYRGIRADGARERGSVEASGEAEAAQILRQRDITPLSISEAGGLLRMEIGIPGITGRTGPRDLAVFARQFATMTASGMSLPRALTVLEEQTTKRPLRVAAREVRGEIEGGAALSAAMARHTKVFPALMIAMIRAGETGGFLDDALEQIAVTLEKEAALRGKVRSAMTYPSVVLAFTALLIAGVLIFIVPIFEQMFHDLGGELPLPTRMLVAVSDSLVWSGPALVIGSLVGGAVARAALRTRPALRLAVDRAKLRLPVFGRLFTKIAVGRFARNLATLLGVGVPVLGALDVVGATTGNAVVASAMGDLQSAVRDGQPMSSGLARHTLFPPMVTQMTQVGEETGQLSQMLDKVADFFDREVDAASDALTSAIEPIMVVMMGGIVGSMVICLYLPLFTIYQNIEGSQ